MTSVDAVTAISAILAEHPPELQRNQADYHLWECRCRQIMGLSDSPLESRHRAHLARVLASHMAGAQAEAWTDGLAVATGMARIYGHTDNWPDAEPANPFTADTGNTE